MRLPAAEPEPAPVVAVSEVAHPMEERIPRRVGDLGQGGRLGAAEVLARDDRPGDDDLADGPVGDLQVVGPERDRIVADPDDLDLDALERAADADAPALFGPVPGLSEDLVAADRGDRQGLGGAIGREDLGGRLEQAGELGEHPGRGRCAGGDDAPERRDGHAPGRQRRADPAQQGRRAEQVRRAEVVDRLEAACRDRPGPGESGPCPGRSPSSPGRGRRGRRAGTCRGRSRPARSRRGRETARPEPGRSHACRRPPWAGPCAAGEEDGRHVLVAEPGGRKAGPRGRSSKARWPSRRMSSSVVSPDQVTSGPTRITRRTDAFPQPRIRLAQTALGMPMKTSGAASSRHLPRLFRPMPGSIRTGTTAALKSAKVRAKKSRPGLTMTAARAPFSMPDSASPHAILSLS